MVAIARIMPAFAALRSERVERSSAAQWHPDAKRRRRAAIHGPPAGANGAIACGGLSRRCPRRVRAGRRCLKRLRRRGVNCSSRDRIGAVAHAVEALHFLGFEIGLADLAAAGRVVAPHEAFGALLHALGGHRRGRDLVGVDRRRRRSCRAWRSGCRPSLVFGAADRAVVVGVDLVEELLAPLGVAGVRRGVVVPAWSGRVAADAAPAASSAVSVKAVRTILAHGRCSWNGHVGRMSMERARRPVADRRLQRSRKVEVKRWSAWPLNEARISRLDPASRERWESARVYDQACFFSQRNSFAQSSWCERTTSEL